MRPTECEKQSFSGREMHRFWHMLSADSFTCTHHLSSCADGDVARCSCRTSMKRSRNLLQAWQASARCLLLPFCTQLSEHTQVSGPTTCSARAADHSHISWQGQGNSAMRSCFRYRTQPPRRRPTQADGSLPLGRVCNRYSTGAISTERMA